jgi:hypothetical protein
MTSLDPDEIKRVKVHPCKCPERKFTIMAVLDAKGGQKMKSSKYFIWLLCLIPALLLGCAGQQQAPAKEQNYQKVFEVDLSKHEIYEKTLQWMAESFVSSKAVIEYKNEEEGIIIGNGAVEMHVAAIYKGLVGYTLKIEIKDKKYRVTTCCFRKADSTTIHPDHYTKRSTVEYAQTRIEMHVDDLYDYLKKEKKSDDW